MAAWDLVLRFGLEVATVVALAAAGWQQASGATRWVAALGLPLVAVLVWGTFNVPGDPSRSGRAPVVVPGWARLVVELAILASGAVAVGVVGGPVVAAGFVALAALHYAVCFSRVRWLISQ
jgi:hypothetical protein